ncbi:MAG TPA: hypothetical protein PKY59_16315 [Pyrinomonadaceae bacterium]|nr:hypothetical protein [Pyrinomonadaceae bacterium]
MKLWYVNIWLSPETGYDQHFRYQFTLHTRFISNYFSKILRKKSNWFETDGSFNMISVEPMPDSLKDCRIVPEKVLTVSVPFDKARYEMIKGTSNYDYYLEMLEAGFRKASNYKQIPLNNLLNLITEFKANGYKNEWIHTNKRFKEYDIEITLICQFTTLDFKLLATINKISTKKPLCFGVILRTDADEICYDKTFKDVFIKEDKIIITDGFDRPSFSINLCDALNKKFNCELLKLN